MTEKEFIAELEARLGRMADREEILDDMREHFAEARAAGRDEASVAASLGDPKELAKEFSAQALARDAGKRPGPLESARLWYLAALDRYPKGTALAIAIPAAALASALVAALALVAASGFGGLAQLALLPFHAFQAELSVPPIAAALVFLGSGLLGAAGIAGVLALLEMAGRKSAVKILDKVKDKPGAFRPGKERQS
jgi:uncharacterized membrane protein